MIEQINCTRCGAKAVLGKTAYVRDFGDCLIVIRSVPCYKCEECTDIFYTAHTKGIIGVIEKHAKTAKIDIAVMDYDNIKLTDKEEMDAAMIEARYLSTDPTVKTYTDVDEMFRDLLDE